MIRNRRTAVRAVLVSLGTAALGTFLFAAPAQASVTVSPNQAVQGGDASLEFKVTNDRPKAYTKTVEIILPAAYPLAEVYPFSVPDWAPKLAYHPATDANGQEYQAVTSLTWIAVGKGAMTPGQPQTLPVDLGPMPTADSFVFTVVQTYSDGTVVRWDSTAEGATNAAPALKLIQGDGTQASSGHDHGSAGDTSATQQAQQPVATNTSTDDSSGIGGSGFALVLAGAALVAGLLAGLVITRFRRSPELTAVLNAEEPEAEAEEPKAKATATRS
jgi:uncharacterized protein